MHLLNVSNERQYFFYELLLEWSQMWKTRCFLSKFPQIPDVEDQMFFPDVFAWLFLFLKSLKEQNWRTYFWAERKKLRGKTELHPNQLYSFKTSYDCLENALIWNISAPHFLAFLLNNSLRIQSEWGKIRTWKFPNTDVFYAVENSGIIRQIRRFID